MFTFHSHHRFLLWLQTLLHCNSVSQPYPISRVKRNRKKCQGNYWLIVSNICCLVDIQCSLEIPSRSLQAKENIYPFFSCGNNLKVSLPWYTIIFSVTCAHFCLPKKILSCQIAENLFYPLRILFSFTKVLKYDEVSLFVECWPWIFSFPQIKQLPSNHIMFKYFSEQLHTDFFFISLMSKCVGQECLLKPTLNKKTKSQTLLPLAPGQVCCPSTQWLLLIGNKRFWISAV